MKTVFQIQITMTSETAKSQFDMQQAFLERIPENVSGYNVIDARITSGLVDKDDVPVQKK